ncbi:MAG: ABC transporter ATP-binding protein [bacterium]
MSNILTVKNLTKTYQPGRGQPKAFTALENVSFSLKDGEILGLLGPNGAGKTTTISILLGTLTPTSGSIKVFGLDYRTHRSEIMSQVTFASTYIRMPWRLTVWENLMVYGHLYGLSKSDMKTRLEKLLKRFGVWDQRDKTMNLLSAGQITMVMLTKAFLSRPRIALLDEPTASLDPEIAKEVQNFVLEERAENGTSIIFTSHKMDEVADICDRVVFIKGGKVVATGTPEDLANSVSLAHVHFRSSELGRIAELAEGLKCRSEKTGHELSISIDETRIPMFLQKISEEGIRYSQISIDKPTLEDFFLSMAKK